MNTPTESVKETRTAYIHERPLVDGDYSAWQRSPVLKSAISSDQMSERPTSPETEIVRLQIKVKPHFHLTLFRVRPHFHKSHFIPF